MLLQMTLPPVAGEHNVSKKTNKSRLLVCLAWLETHSSPGLCGGFCGIELGQLGSCSLDEGHGKKSHLRLGELQGGRLELLDVWMTFSRVNWASSGGAGIVAPSAAEGDSDGRRPMHTHNSPMTGEDAAHLGRLCATGAGQAAEEPRRGWRGIEKVKEKVNVKPL